MTDWITQYGSGSSINDISLTTLYDYLKNPYSNIKNIRLASKYFSNKYGLIKDVLRIYKSLPTLNYHLAWSSFDNPKQIKKYEQKLFQFLDTINVRKFLRDGLYEVAEQGTIVVCLRKEKYVQFLELDDIRINKQLNGKWVVEYDLSSIKQSGSTVSDILAVIESLPDEVTLGKFNNYRNKGGDENRFVELKNCWVIASDSPRNYPFGMPVTMGAWASLIQMEIINRVERSIADRLIKQVLILYTSTIGGDKNNPGQPVPKPTVDFYFNSLKTLLLKKENNSSSSSITDLSGTGLATLPYFFDLKPLEINTTMFTKELYQKIENDIYSNLGVSKALISGGSDNANYSTASLNTEKLFKQLFSILEVFEDMINDIIKEMLPTNLSCKFFFDRVTTLDSDKYIDKCKELYQLTGVFTLWAEALTGVPYHYIVGLVQYEKEVLQLDTLLNPPQNPFNQTGDNNVGRPEDKSGGGKNANTDKSKNNNGNANPKPSKN